VWVGVASADPDYLPNDAMIATWDVPKHDDAFTFPGESAHLVASAS